MGARQSVDGKSSFGGKPLLEVNMGATAVGTGLNADPDGIVAAVELNPPKARGLLQQALTKTKDVSQIQKYFGEY